MKDCEWLKDGRCKKPTQCKVDIVRFASGGNKVVCVNVTPPGKNHALCWAYLDDEDCAQLGLKEIE